MLLSHARDVLHGRRSTVHADRAATQLPPLATLVIVFGMLYGAVMGSFGGFVDGGLWQVLYSAIKAPFLLLVTFLLGLPSFFVVNTLLGLRDDFGEAVRALVATQAGLTIILASFAPFTVLWYLSFESYEASLLFNAATFGAASVSAQLLLRRFYRPLIQRDPRHRTLLRVWLVIYAFVGVQMAWVLRPFVGAPGQVTTFFRENAWGNAYVEVAGIVWRLIGG